MDSQVQSPAAAGERPMWCDGFDMDLPKVFPQSRGMIGELADLRLVVRGRTTGGVLNHPSVWNTPTGALISYFGIGAEATPPNYVTDHPLVECTVWEAFRDAWSHHYILTVDHRRVWNTWRLTAAFDLLLAAQRCWAEPSAGDIRRARMAVLTSFPHAVTQLRKIVAEQKGGARHGG